MPQIAKWPATPLSEILKLRGSDAPAAAQALARVLEVYRGPIRGFVAQHIPREHSSHADDWTQGFIVKFIEQSLTANWDPEIGHLRHYVARALHNYLRDQIRAIARRPERPHEPGALAETANADHEFHRGWAEVVVSRALDRLDLEAAGDSWRSQRVQLLRLRYGIGMSAPLSYEQISAALGRQLQRHEIDNALRAARRDFVDALREEVGSLMASDPGIDPEIWALSDLLDG